MTKDHWARRSIILGILLAGIAMLMYPVLAVAEDRQANESLLPAATNYANCRFGVGVTAHSITTYNIDQLRLGWYVDWNARLSPIKPAGMDFYHTIRIKQDKSGSTYLPSYRITPTLGLGANELGPMVQANPGNTWIIGNEPDRVYYQDETLPDMYAQIYHDAYAFIKGIDPTAKIAIGGVIQPTPVRLQYLDMILAAYRARYGATMPIDVWNVHLYILQEDAHSWGASIPPGITATTGMLYTIPQHVDINVFSGLVRDMRNWMKTHGYQNTPLIVTEYGILFPMWLLEDNGLSQASIYNFLNAAINYLNSASDSNIGYPADNYRLVQQAALYSLDDDSVDQNGDYRWGSFLFRSSAPFTMTDIGVQYKTIMSTLPASVDLLPYAISTSPSSLIISPSETVTPTVKVMVSNAGNSTPPISVTVRFYDVTGGIQSQVGSDVVLPPFTGCGYLREASVAWPDLAPGTHVMRIKVDPDSLIVESQKSNNVMTATVFIGTYGIYLPVTFR